VLLACADVCRALAHARKQAGIWWAAPGFFAENPEAKRAAMQPSGAPAADVGRNRRKISGRDL